MGFGYSKKVHRADAQAFIASTIEDRRRLMRRIRYLGPCRTNVLYETFSLLAYAQVALSNAQGGGDKGEIAAARREHRRAWALARNAAKRCGRRGGE